MPIIQIHMGEGRTVHQKRALVAGITDAVITALGVRGEQVRILIEELAPEHFAVAGTTTAQKQINADLLAKAGAVTACETAAANQN